jgi:hypothetical protein
MTGYFRVVFRQREATYEATSENRRLGKEFMAQMKENGSHGAAYLLAMLRMFQGHSRMITSAEVFPFIFFFSFLS